MIFMRRNKFTPCLSLLFLACTIFISSCILGKHHSIKSYEGYYEPEPSYDNAYLLGNNVCVDSNIYILPTLEIINYHFAKPLAIYLYEKNSGFKKPIDSLKAIPFYYHRPETDYNFYEFPFQYGVINCNMDIKIVLHNGKSFNITELTPQRLKSSPVPDILCGLYSYKVNGCKKYLNYIYINMEADSH